MDHISTVSLPGSLEHARLALFRNIAVDHASEVVTAALPDDVVLAAFGDAA
jgi:hypothetical protein